MEIFNEQELRKEIVKTWGAYGVHVEVFDRMAEPKENIVKKYFYTFIAVYAIALTILMFLMAADNERLNAEKRAYFAKWMDERAAHGATKGELARQKDDYKYLLKWSAKK